MKLKGTIIATLTAFTTVCNVQAQFVVNGGFEFGLTGWTASGAVDYSPGNSSEGTNSARFNAHEATPSGVLSQTIATVPGDTYRLIFDFGSWCAGGPSEQRLAVEVKGNATLISTNITEIGEAGIMQMNRYVFPFVADSTASSISFRDVSLQTVSTDGHLDNVSVESRQLSVRVSQVELCWDSPTNKLFQVQYRSAFTLNQWTDLGSPITSTNVITCFYDNVPAGEPQRFYRVLQVPQ